MKMENNNHKEETRYRLANATMAMLLLSADKGILPNNTYALSEKIHMMKNNKLDVGDIFLKRGSIRRMGLIFTMK